MGPGSRAADAVCTSSLAPWVSHFGLTRHKKKSPRVRGHYRQNLERETGFEPATSTLARSHSTAELLPLSKLIINTP